MNIFKFGVQMICDYIRVNWILLVLPSVLWFVMWHFYKNDKKRFNDIDKKVTYFRSKMLIVFILAIISVILYTVKNPLAVVVIMVITGEVINIVLILVESADLLNNERTKYWRIVKEEYKKYFNQKKLHHKNIMKGYDVRLEKSEYERKEEIIGCATITIILLAIYSFCMDGSELTYMLLSYVTGKFMWMDGGIVEGLSSICYYIKRELSTVVVLVILWGMNYFLIEKYNCDIYAFCIGLIPFVFYVFVLKRRYRRK